MILLLSGHEKNTEFMGLIYVFSDSAQLGGISGNVLAGMEYRLPSTEILISRTENQNPVLECRK